jgi:hypothetical protein
VNGGGRREAGDVARKDVANRDVDGDGGGVSDLLGAVARDAGALAGQHLDLLRAELRHDLAEAGLAAASIGAGAGLTAAAGMLGALMLVHKLHSATRLPLWGCYGLVGGALGALGAGLIGAGVQRAGGVDLVPRQSLAALREDFEWVKHQAADFAK